MSTKTTFKRISLVAVAALGLGVLSVAPSQAAAAAVTFTYTNGTALTATPVVGTAVQLPISVAAAGTFEAATSSLVATVSTKPTNSTLGTESTTVSIATAAAAITTSAITESFTAAVAGTSGAGISFAATASSTTLTAANAAVFSFTPDVAGYYIITFTTGGTGTQAFVANTVGVNVSGAAIVQAATGLGKSAGTQINGRPSAAAFFLPAASTTSSRYEISAIGAGIVGIFALSSKADAASATTSTSATGVTKKNGTDFTAGATYAGAATTTGAIAVASAITDGFIVTTTSAAAATVVITVKSVNITTGELTDVSSATIIYGAAPVTLLAASAVAHNVGGTNTPNVVVGQADSATSVSKDTVGRVATIGVKLYNTSSAEVTTESYTATISGAGTLGTSTSNAIVGRGLTVKYGDNVYVYADGTAGVGTITITTAAGLAVATKSVSFYGAPAAITMSVRRELAPNSTLAADVVRAQVFDALGYPVNGAVVYATSSDTTIISTSYASFTTATDISSAGVVTEGIAKIGLTGVKLGSAKITVGLASSATDVTTTGYAIKSDATTINVVGSTAQQGGVIVAMDKQSYAPGSYAWVTITPVDAAGKKLAPNVAYTVFSSTGITASQPVESSTAGVVGSAIWGATVTGATSSNASTRTVADPVVELDGTKIQKIKLPNIEGDFTISWTTAAAANFPGLISAGGVAGSVTVTLSNPGSQAAVDAAAEATDAANAATDAALAAADAADAATAAAEDASASVAKLSKSVTTALNNLKKQITSLTALVNKLLKR
jgi:hypothetical protein